MKTNYVRVAVHEEPDTHPRKDTTSPPNIASDDGTKQSEDILEPGRSSPEGRRTLHNRLGRGSDLIPPTHPDIEALMSIKQQSQEKVHHFWARFLLVKDKVKDCRDEDIISAFRNNCTNKGLLNAINRHRILHFADLATIVQMYNAMKSALRDQTVWELSVPTQPLVQANRAHPREAPSPIAKKYKPITRCGTVLEGWLDGPCKIHTTPDTISTQSLRACWILRQVARAARTSLPKTPQSNTLQKTTTPKY